MIAALRKRKASIIKMAKHTDITKPIVLIIDDEYRSFRSLLRLISSDWFSVTWVPDEQQGLKTLKDQAEKVRNHYYRFEIVGDGRRGLFAAGQADCPSGGNIDHGTLGAIFVPGGYFL